MSYFKIKCAVLFLKIRTTSLRSYEEIKFIKRVFVMDALQVNFLAVQTDAIQLKE